MATLLVTDVQNDFCLGGSLSVPDGEEVVPVINSLIPHFAHVVNTQDWHPAGHQSFASSHNRAPFSTIELAYGEQILWPDHCIGGLPGADFHPKLDTARSELIIRKGFRSEIDSYSAFFENDHRTPTGLTGYLRERGLNTLFLVGLATDFCVKWSALDGKQQDFDIYVIQDATRGIDTEGSLARAWEEMHRAGVHIVSSQEAVEKILQTA